MTRISVSPSAVISRVSAGDTFLAIWERGIIIGGTLSRKFNCAGAGMTWLGSLIRCAGTPALASKLSPSGYHASDTSIGAGIALACLWPPAGQVP